METSQEHNFFQPNDQTVRLSSSSSSSSSSSCSSIEAEPRPDENPNYNQSPPTQIMERTTTTSTPTTPPYRIPSHVFARTPSTAPAEWSTLSNESLFSIRMGNNSFNANDYFKSGELTFPQPPSPRTPHLPSPLPSPRQNTNQGGGGGGGGGGSGVVEEAKTPVDVGKKAAETEKASPASKEEEQKFSCFCNRLGNADKGGLQSSTPPKKQTKPSQPETPKSSSESEGDEGLKKEEAPKPEAAPNRTPKWLLSCFPCCTTCCV